MSTCNPMPSAISSSGGGEISLHTDELGQAILIKCLRSAGPRLGLFVEKALREKFPGRSECGVEEWRRRCTSSLPLSVRKHSSPAMTGDDQWSDVFAILEVARTYMRSVFLPLSKNLTEASTFEHLEQLSREINAVQQCRNWIFHFLPVSHNELTACLKVLKRLLARFTMESLCRNEDVLNIDHCLDILLWAKESNSELSSAEKSPILAGMSPKAPSVGQYKDLQVPDFSLDKEEASTVLVMRALRVFAPPFRSLLGKSGACLKDSQLNHQERYNVDESELDVKVLLEDLRRLCRLPLETSPMSSVVRTKLKHSATFVRIMRNKVAHNSPFSSSEAQRCVQECINLLETLSALVSKPLGQSCDVTVLKQCILDLQSLSRRRKFGYSKTDFDKSFGVFSSRVTLSVELPYQQQNQGFSVVEYEHEVEQHPKYVETVLSVQHRIAFPLPTLYGREEDLSSLVRMLSSKTDRSKPRVLLTGHPGVGKTALAISASAQLRNVYRSQYLLQASSVESMYADISVEGQQGLFNSLHCDSRARASAVLDFLASLPESLIVFDDLFDPRLVRKLIQLGKHAMLFITHSRKVWQQWPDLNCQITHHISAKQLSNDKAYRLFESVISRGKWKNSAMWEKVEKHRELFKQKLREEMENLPLAIILLATLLSENILPLTQLFHSDSLLDRVSISEEEANGASFGDRHVRGVSGIVEFALLYLPNDLTTKHLLFLMAFIPCREVPVWFLKLVLYEAGHTSVCMEECLSTIAVGGLVQDRKLGNSRSAKLSMHSVVRGCILEKWMGEPWAEKLEKYFFITSMLLIAQQKRIAFTNQHYQEVKAMYFSVCYRMVDSQLRGIDSRFCKASGCYSFSHFCLPALFLRTFFDRIDYLDMIEFRSNNLLLFALQRVLQASLMGFYILRDWVPAILKNDKIWSLFFDKAGLYFEKVQRFDTPKLLLAIRLLTTQAFIQANSIVHHQLVRCFKLLLHHSQQANWNSERKVTPEKFANRTFKGTTLEWYEGRLGSPSVSAVCNNDVKLKIERGGPRPTPETQHVESACDNDANLNDKVIRFVLSTSSSWSLKDANELEKYALLLLSNYEEKQHCQARPFADAVLVTWAALFSDKYAIAVDIINEQCQLMEGSSYHQRVCVAMVLIAVTILLYFRGTPELITEMACNALLFTSLSTVSVKENHSHSNEEDVDKELSLTYPIAEVENQLISFLGESFCAAEIDEQMIKLISNCTNRGQRYFAETLSQHASAIMEKRVIFFQHFKS